MSDKTNKKVSEYSLLKSTCDAWKEHLWEIQNNPHYTNCYRNSVADRILMLEYKMQKTKEKENESE